MASWTFAAAVSWLVLATIGFAIAAIALLTLLAVQFAALVAVGAVAIPFLFARGIVRQSSAAAMFASIYGFGLAAAALFELGPSIGMLSLIWLGAASAMAVRDLARTDPLI
jgi:hypothetical protein